MHWNLSGLKYKSSFLRKFLACKLNDTIAVRTWEALIGNFLWACIYSSGNSPPLKKSKKWPAYLLQGCFEFHIEQSLFKRIGLKAWLTSWIEALGGADGIVVFLLPGPLVAVCILSLLLPPQVALCILQPALVQVSEGLLRLVSPSTQSYWVIESLLPSMYLYRVACGCQ